MKVAFIIQRFGSQVFGGAEKHCQKIVEKLKDHVDIEVLTTCALDYVTWENHYAPGYQIEEGIPIRRFPVDFKRETHMFNRCYDFLINLHMWHGLDRGYDLREKIDPLALKQAVEKKEKEKEKHEIFSSLELVDSIEKLWMKTQGPHSSELRDYVQAQKNRYDAFIFFSYHYWTTFSVLPLVREKAILVPTAHPDPSLSFRMFRNFFSSVRKVLYNTMEEKDLLESTMENYSFPYNDIVGVGIDIPRQISPKLATIKYKIDDPFIISVGRLDESKGYTKLFEFFTAYKKCFPSALKLVVIGEGTLHKPVHDDIIFLGHVSSELDKFSLIKASQCLVTASPYESLSMVLLEAWGVKVPVLVEKSCKVLRGQCERSGGGLMFSDEQTFAESLKALLENDTLRDELGQKGYEFFSKNYTWDIIINKYKKALLIAPHKILEENQNFAPAYLEPSPIQNF